MKLFARILAYIRSAQEADVKRMFLLSVEGVGELGSAAVLAANIDGVSTAEEAASFAKKQTNITRKIILKELHFRWAAERFAEIEKNLKDVDFRAIKNLDRGAFSTRKLFEDKIKDINHIIENKNSGLIYCIDQIIKDSIDYEHKRLNPDGIGLLSDLKVRAQSIIRISWRIQHPILYVILSKKTIKICLILFAVTIPLWYFFGYHARDVVDSVSYPLQTINGDLTKLGSIKRSDNTNILLTTFYFSKNLWEMILVIPSLFLILAAILSISRTKFGLTSEIIAQSEESLLAIGARLRNYLPPSKDGPLLDLELKMVSGDNIEISIGGSNSGPINIKSVIKDSFKGVENKFDADVEKFLKDLGDFIAKSGDARAANQYKKLTNELKDETPDKNIVKTIWDGMLKILPPVGSLAGAAGAIAKLIG